MADLGLTFADAGTPGVDLILPDLEFIEARRDDLVGIVLTHGHEDHIGALPYLAADLKVPLYATPFTAGLIAGKLEEEGLTGQVRLIVIERGGSIELDPFRVTYVPLAHSIPEGNGLLIETPHGNIFHTGDWKLDDAPVLGHPSSAATLTALGDAGVLALVCDSTNVFQDAASGSESSVHAGLLSEVRKAKGRVVVTTFASNAARLETIGRVATEAGRQVCVAGRSLDRILKVKAGDAMADIGAGTGYYTRRLAKMVGDHGLVYAVDIQPEMLDLLTNKMAQAGLTNLIPVLGTLTNPKLPRASVDLILMVDVYHEFSHPYEMTSAMIEALKPGGRMIFVEFRGEDPKVAIKRVHKMTEAQVRKEMAVYPLTWVETQSVLPQQHIIVFRKQ